MKQLNRDPRALTRTQITLAIGTALVASFLGWGCSSEDGSDLNGGRAVGTEGGACLPSGGCDVGLTCKEKKCVKSAGSGGSSGTGGGSGASSGGTGGGSGGSGGSSGSSGSTGGTSDGGGSGGASGSSGAGGSGGASCDGTHPLLDAGARLCAAGQCRCEVTDLCFPQNQAARCCAGRMRCFDVDGGLECEGTHPLVDGGNRSCSAANCYCAANDTCYPTATARACCSVAPSCN